DLSGNPSFKEFLDRIRDVALGAYVNQDVPVEMVLEVLQPERKLNHSPLFQVMFILQTVPRPDLSLLNLTATPIHVDSRTTKFDLTLYMEDTGRGLTGALEYSTDIFEEATIARMLKHYEQLLESVASDPDQPISRVRMLTEGELQHLLVTCNDTEREFPRHMCVHELFEEMVEQSPDAVAVEYEGEELSYKELDERANRLAHHLISLGVRAEMVVGISVERSLEMVVGLVAILKAGGAYLALDASYPLERLAYMVEDSGCRVVITEQRSAEKYEALGAKVVRIDEPDVWEERKEKAKVEVSSENLAYVMYTSGSSGEPKGVCVTHRSVVNYAQAAIAQYEISSRDRILQFASISFDASAEE